MYNKSFWNEYKDYIMMSFKNQYKLYKEDKYKGAEKFLRIIRDIHGSFKEDIPESFLSFTKGNNLNYGSFGGILFEWLFKFAIECFIIENGKTDLLEVINDYTVPYKRKTKGNKLVNIDIVLKKKGSKKILLCFEIKTNFEDKFEKYYNEQNIIYHHRTKVFKDFKYYYISFSLIPKGIGEKNRSNIQTLKNRKELFIFPLEHIQTEEIIQNCVIFLEDIYTIIEKFE